MTERALLVAGFLAAVMTGVIVLLALMLAPEPTA